MTNPDNFAGLDRGHFLSTTGNCNTFDDAANGYCRADAVGTIIMKRLEDAEVRTGLGLYLRKALPGSLQQVKSLEMLKSGETPSFSPPPHRAPPLI